MYYYIECMFVYNKGWGLLIYIFVVYSDFSCEIIFIISGDYIMFYDIWGNYILFNIVFV